MPDNFQEYSLVITSGTTTLDLTVTVDLSQSDLVDTQYSDATGSPITLVSGTLTEGSTVSTISGLVATNAYLGNNNLYSPVDTPAGPGLALDYSGVSFTIGTTDYNLFYHVGGNDNGWTLDTGSKNNPTHVFTGGAATVTTVCFCTGTLIATTRGEVAVEDLAVGDLAVTATGVARPITWIGHKRRVRPMREEQPVRVMAGAFGESLPRRDLFLSPGHAVCVDVMDAVFVPVGELINGATIAQVEGSEVTYWHVELESHDVLLAEGFPCESYMDAGNRAFFGREYGRLQAADPERTSESLTRYVRPFVNRGPLVEAIRERLAARAEALGWTRTSDLDLHLVVDGQRIEPTIDGDLARFILPAEAGEARLVSRTFVPERDRRRLGLGIKGLTVSDGLRLNREVPLEAIAEGAYTLEHDDQRLWRWTDGDAVLPASLWQGCNGLAILTVAFNPKAGRSWIAPQDETLARRAA